MKELKNWFLKNIDIKLLSLFLAIILWLYIAGGENPVVENFIDISLTQTNLSEDLAIKEFPTNASVGIKGPRNIINNIFPNQISGIVNFSEISKEGLYKLKVEAAAPKRTQITGIIPSENIIENIKQTNCTIDISEIKKNLNRKIKVRAVGVNGNDIKEVMIEPGIVEVSISLTRGYPEKQLAVKPRIVGKPAPGYYISEILSSPDEIKIFGNYSKISTIEFLETIPIDVTGITKTLSVKVPPTLDEGLNIAEGEVELIEVSIQVKEAIIERIIKSIPVLPQNISPFIFCEIRPEVVDITVEGKNILVDKLEAQDIKAFVMFTDNFRVEQKVKVQVDLPEGISLIKVEPEEVTVLIN